MPPKKRGNNNNNKNASSAASDDSIFATPPAPAPVAGPTAAAPVAAPQAALTSSSSSAAGDSAADADAEAAAATDDTAEPAPRVRTAEEERERELTATRQKLLSDLRRLEAIEGANAPSVLPGFDPAASRKHQYNVATTPIFKAAGAEAQLKLALAAVERFVDAAAEGKAREAYWQSRWQRATRISQLTDQTLADMSKNTSALSAIYDDSTAAMRAQLAAERARNDDLQAKQQAILHTIDTQVADMLSKQRLLLEENDSLRAKLTQALDASQKLQHASQQVERAYVAERASLADSLEQAAVLVKEERAKRLASEDAHRGDLQGFSAQFKEQVRVMEEARKTGERKDKVLRECQETFQAKHALDEKRITELSLKYAELTKQHEKLKVVFAASLKKQQQQQPGTDAAAAEAAPEQAAESAETAAAAAE